ncbi:unnamed protein product [Chrysodeixis includens]|uniref:Tudor domain-containing protein n=1 Tax=Chrysodeixis includens TaxID=689277 RepID=A0A9P0DWX2_CHRIL|nr:unnamed protein product [Chrysodeixis includens]
MCTEELPSFGCVVPLTTLPALVRDMNSPATKADYKPLTVTPAEGELVAALYPPDYNWYRARVLSVQRADQSVEAQPFSWRKFASQVLPFPKRSGLPFHWIQGEELPSFGCVVPLTTLPALVRDMNSPATKADYKPLTVTPAEGELVAALYPPDYNWYRARVLSVQRADQSVEAQPFSWRKFASQVLPFPKRSGLPFHWIQGGRDRSAPMFARTLSLMPLSAHLCLLLN